jgi:biotin carboxylase
MGFSKMKRVMVEEYIKRTHDYMIGGDIFVLNGKVAFWGLMNSFRNRKISEFIPVGTSFPTLITPEQFGRVSDLVHEVIGVLNIQSGPFNLEMMFGEDGNLYMIEMNPRSGGNQIPEILKVATGVNLVEATVRAALGEGDIRFDSNKEQKFMSTYVLHSSQSGVLEGVNIHEAINKYVVRVTMHKQLGDTINKFENAGELVGVVLMKFPSLEEMQRCLDNIPDLIGLSVSD